MANLAGQYTWEPKGSLDALGFGDADFSADGLSAGFFDVGLPLLVVGGVGFAIAIVDVGVALDVGVGGSCVGSALGADSSFCACFFGVSCAGAISSSCVEDDGASAACAPPSKRVAAK